MKPALEFFFAAFVLCMSACSPKGDGSVSEAVVNGNKMFFFSLNNLKSDTTILPLSSILENCSLVQLETKDDAFFRPWFTTVTENFIGVRQQGGNPYKLFDRKGKFLCNVGAVGQGPGEYVFPPYDAIIDDKNELIYMAPIGDNKILVYNTSGQFIKDFVAPFRLQKAKIFLSDDILTVVHMPFPTTKSMALQFDINSGMVLKETAPLEHLIVKNYDLDIINTRNAPEILDFAFMNCDTLYHFDVKSNMINPAFKIAYKATEKPWMVCFQINKDLLFTNVSILGKE
jgi:hypothetical protein